MSAVASAPSRAVSIANRHPRLRLDRAALVRAIHTLDADAAKFRGGPPPGELSLVFLTDAALARVHADFLADPSITDVITFAADPAFGAAGEICVSVDAALRQRRAPRTTSSSERHSTFSTELTLYVVHGWLHLAGYDDLQPAKKRRMRRAEARAMSLLRAHEALPRFAVASARSRSRAR